MIDPRRSAYPRPQLDQVGQPDPGTSHAIMLDMVGSGKRVLELGCSNGYMSRLLKQRGCQVVGLEIDPAAAAEARAFCEEVIVADLDTRRLVDLLPATPFDVAIFGDVLEHLRDPWRILDEARSFLAEGSFAVLSIPNIAHGSVRLALLKGSFDYQPQGLLDYTHLRFFTLRSVRELCLRSGYRIEEIRRTKADLFSASPLLPQVNAEDFDAALVAEILSDPEHDTVQFIVKVVPLSDDQKIADIVSNISEIETKLRVANEQNERLQSALDAQRGELAALVAWNNQLAAHRESDREALRAELEQVQMLAESERETFAAAFAEHRAIFEGEYRNELDAVTKELNARRQDVSALQAALNAAQAEHQVMSADLRGYEARLAEIGGIRVLSSELQVQNSALRADLESGREHYLKLAAELESERERSRDFALDAESERLRHAAWAKDATERAEQLEAELKAAREERAQLEAFALELTRRETEKIREEIALLDQAIRETYSSRIWRLKLRIGRLRDRFRKA